MDAAIVEGYRYGFYPICFQTNRGKLSTLFERQPKVFMTENNMEKLMMPQMRRAPDHERFKLIVVILLFALIIIGSVAAVAVWSGAAN